MENNFKQGFVKRALEYGFTEKQAIDWADLYDKSRQYLSFQMPQLGMVDAAQKYSLNDISDFAKNTYTGAKEGLTNGISWLRNMSFLPGKADFMGNLEKLPFITNKSDRIYEHGLGGAALNALGAGGGGLVGAGLGYTLAPEDKKSKAMLLGGLTGAGLGAAGTGYITGAGSTEDEHKAALRGIFGAMNL